MYIDKKIFLNIYLLFIIFISSFIYSVNNINQRLENNKKIDSYINNIFFTSNSDISEIIVDLIRNEKRSIKVAVFVFTNKKISNALINAKKAGVDVQVIIDNLFFASPYGVTSDLLQNGIKLWNYNKSSSDMHDKFIIFSDNSCKRCKNGKNLVRRFVLTGSYNFTVKNNDKNHDNIIILGKSSIVDSFDKEFESIKRNSQIVKLV
jgi:phosphatidylserine/phosphatidylglycerophosphate/cardiolipin synthase-like enzyme